MIKKIVQYILNEFKTAPRANKLRFITFALIALSAAIADLSITYIGSPDLAFEANPLITVFGLGWTALIVANIIVYIFSLFLLYMAFIKYRRKIIECETFPRYLSMLYFDRPDKQKWLLYKFPKGNDKILMCFAPVGYAVAYVFPVIRLVAIFGWIMFLTFPEICFLCFFGMPHIFFQHIEIVFFAALGTLLLLTLVYYWYKKEYKINKVALESISSGEYVETKPVQKIKPDKEAKQIAKIEAKQIAETEAMVNEIKALKNIGWASSRFSEVKDID